MLTPYQVIKKVNEVLKSAGQKELPFPMGYNYVKKGYIPSTDGLVSYEDAAEWATKYLTKKLGLVSTTA
mgnify:CR=1 FL=1